MFEVVVGRPWWSVGPLAWVARKLGWDRGWSARGTTGPELGQDLERLAAEQGLGFSAVSSGTWELGGCVVTLTELLEAESPLREERRGAVNVLPANVRPVLGEGRARS